MRFAPLSEEEIQKSSLLPEGIYAYKVLESEDKVSQAGNDYVKIILQVWDNEGKAHIVYSNMALIKLLKHFCDVNNMQDDYLSGNVPAEKFKDKSGGMVILEIEDEKPNGKGGMYKAKNIVKDYVSEPKSSSLTPLIETNKDKFIDDIIPF